MKRAAIVTASSLPEPHPDDLLLARALRDRGREATLAAWDDPAVDWPAFDVAVLRTAWNYHLKAGAFERWIESLERAGVTLVNPAPTVRWNLHKRYLIDLARAGAPVVDTRLVEAGTHAHLLQAIANAPWLEIVVKPAVSSTAYHTYRVMRGASLPDELVAAVGEIREWILQPFVRSVLEKGELSAICIGGSVSHVVRKVASAGDFRVQSDFGGTVLDEPFSEDDARFIAHVLESLPVRWTYARVDWASDPEPRVMEVELIEPELFLARQPSSAERLADAVVRELA